MSAGAPLVDRDMGKLAPRFRLAVEASLADCVAAGLDAYVYEAYRSLELAELYWKRGRPPTPEYPKPVTNARSNLYSWHGFSLAVDVISKAHGWNPPAGWWDDVAAHFKANGMKWGGDWRQRDLPHHQWGPCKPSPSDRARELIAQGGVQAVWEAVSAV